MAHSAVTYTTREIPNEWTTLSGEGAPLRLVIAYPNTISKIGRYPENQENPPRVTIQLGHLNIGPGSRALFISESDCLRFHEDRKHFIVMKEGSESEPALTPDGKIMVRFKSGVVKAEVLNVEYLTAGDVRPHHVKNWVNMNPFLKGVADEEDSEKGSERFTAAFLDRLSAVNADLSRENGAPIIEKGDPLTLFRISNKTQASMQITVLCAPPKTEESPLAEEILLPQYLVEVRPELGVVQLVPPVNPSPQG